MRWTSPSRTRSFATGVQGYEALYLPGTDHASIATEAKIVEAMREEV